MGFTDVMHQLGPEASSVRLQRMLEVMETAVMSILTKGVSEDKAVRCFEPVLKRSQRVDEAFVRELYDKLFVEQVKNNVQAELENICVEHDMGNKLRLLEQLSDKKAADESTGEQVMKVLQADVDPNEIVGKAVCEAKERRIAMLREQLDKVKRENQELRLQLEEVSQEKKKLHQQVESIFVPIEKTKQLCLSSK